LILVREWSTTLYATSEKVSVGRVNRKRDGVFKILKTAFHIIHTPPTFTGIAEKQCQQPACPHWRLGAWSTCSTSCLDGFTTRTVECVDGVGVRLSNERCTKRGELRPPTHQPCSNGPCPYWRVGEWSQCSVSCGKGTRKRGVECIYKEQAVDDSLCADHRPPPRHEPCTLIGCTQWTTAEWEPCSVTCGQGLQRRRVQGTREDGGVGLHASECPREQRPRAERSCEKDPCGSSLFQSVHQFRWIAGPWDECSTDCGDGEQKRLVRCLDASLRELPNDYCRLVDWNWWNF